MRLSELQFWGGLAAGVIVLGQPRSVAQAQGLGDMTRNVSETTITLPEVSVSAQPDETFFAPDTASQGVVTGKQIEEQPRSRVGEVLEMVPGLIATQHSGEGKANQYFLRGFNLDHGTDIEITLEDMPVNMRTHGLR
jgi:outer membrane cobalamin receptor